MISTKTQTLIAAYNEAEYIGPTLERLNSSEIEPYVIVNGSNDATAEVAQKYGATTYVLEEAGKLPAIQYGLRMLGGQALEPIIFLDADSYPVFPRAWPGAMTRRLSTDGPSCVSGMTYIGDLSPVESFRKNTRRFAKIANACRRGSTGMLFGANMAVRLHNNATLEEVLALPHIWPGEDRAIADLINARGDFHQSMDPRSYVRMHGRYEPPVRKLSTSKKESKRSSLNSYLDRAPPTATMTYMGGRYLPREEAADQL